MPRFRYDKDMECIVEVREGANFYDDTPKGPTIISDIEPYRAVASDVACGGKLPVISGRRQHREFLARNGYTEIGNERPMQPGNTPSPREAQRERVEDIKRSLGEYGSDTGRRH